MDLVKKAVGLVDTVETDSPNGAFEVVLSAATLDRDGEIIDSRAFDPLPDHVPFDIDHGMTVQTTVGSGQPYYAEDGSLRVKGTFASTPLAQEVRTLVAEGHIRTTSVTFMAAERENDEKSIPHVTRAELLNGTFTPVPSNREAVVLSAKALDAAVTSHMDDVKAVSKAAGIQSAHDTLVSAGAVCSGKSVSDGDDTKTVTEAPAAQTQEDETADETAGAAADEAAAPAVKSAATPPEVLARLSVMENAARLAFGA
jgi:HK97 family phage prohead protease